MAFEFRLPDIGEGVVEGEIVSWKVKVGDALALDQPMVEVMTDKATVEIPSPRAGRVLSIDVAEGAICKVGQVMLRIETGAGAGAAAAEAGSHAAKQQHEAPPRSGNGAAAPVLAVVSGAAAPAGERGKALATPATRKLARDLGVDLALVPASGDGGRVTAGDVRAFAGGGHAASQHKIAAPQHAAQSTQSTWKPAPVAREVADERIPFRGVRKKIAENMSRSKHTAAHFTYVEEADLTDLVALRARARKRAEERGVKLSYLPFIIKAVVAGLKKFPIVNATLDETSAEIVVRKRYHIGIATASEQGLIVPVVKDADRKSLFEIARELDELARKVREGRASRDELTGSTFTISSLGQLGGVLATPIINYPEVAILGVHKIKPTPAVVDGQIAIREIGNFSISLDHRIVDGYEGAQFLQHVIELLSDPTLLFLELV
jgi:pyruvate dehydrogenase E2 component (dihydrolipoamide acetyltransferase)